jgi:hypothetical protein
MRPKPAGRFASFLAALLAGAAAAYATDISGTIATTLTITDDSKLVGDVTCTVTDAPCIAVGAPGITLDLNGFSMTGLADAQTACGGVPPTPIVAPNPGEDGIDASGQTGVTIRGPGLVRQFRRMGVSLRNSTGVTVTSLTISTNCAAGIILVGGSGHDVNGNVSVRNGNVMVACGGI